MNTYRRTHLLEVNTLARSARVKMVKECHKADMDLRHVVGHANFLDHLKHVTLQAHLQIITERPERQVQQVKTSSKEVTSEHMEDINEDTAMTFESTPYATAQASTVSVISCDEDEDTSSDSSDSDDSDTYNQDMPTRPAPAEPIVRSKPIAIPSPKVSVTAVEVI